MFLIKEFIEVVMVVEFEDYFVFEEIFNCKNGKFFKIIKSLLGLFELDMLCDWVGIFEF